MDEIFCDSHEEKAARYCRIRRIGEGAFGDVSLAVDRFTGIQVALKDVRIMTRGTGIPRAVFRELEALKQLQGNNSIVRLYDYFPKETKLCLVLEFLPSTLADVIETAKSYLSIQQIKKFAFMLLEGISYCHSRNLIHRDIKPSS